MNLKIILPVVLILLIGVVGVVYAGYSASQQQITILIEKGWNLIPTSSWEINNQNSPIKYPQDFKYDYIYDVLDKKYVLGLKDGKTLDSIGPLVNTNNNDPDIVRYYLQSSIWVYSEKEGYLILDWGNVYESLKKVSNIKLNEGWNFLFVIPEMKGMSFNDFKGDCDIIKYCGYQFQKWQCVEWSSLTQEILESGTMADTDSDIGAGFIIKVSDDCTLGSSTGGTSPPGLPGDSQEESPSCTDSDGGKRGFEKGKTCFKEECKEDYCRAEGEDFPLQEYFCYPDGIGGGVYPCLNGCLNGACIPNEEGVTGCVDSDDGKDYYKKGTITWGEITAEDLCQENKLTEFFCDLDFDSPDESHYTCPNGCSNGACIQ